MSPRHGLSPRNWAGLSSSRFWIVLQTRFPRRTEKGFDMDSFEKTDSPKIPQNLLHIYDFSICDDWWERLIYIHACVVVVKDFTLSAVNLELPLFSIVDFRFYFSRNFIKVINLSCFNGSVNKSWKLPSALLGFCTLLGMNTVLLYSLCSTFYPPYFLLTKKYTDYIFCSYAFVWLEFQMLAYSHVCLEHTLNIVSKSYWPWRSVSEKNQMDSSISQNFAPPDKKRCVLQTFGEKVVITTTKCSELN